MSLSRESQTGRRNPAGRSFGFHQGKAELFFQGHYFAQPFHYILNAIKLIFDSFKIKVLRFQQVADAKQVCGTTHFAL
jgi:hypothetical protein